MKVNTVVTTKNMFFCLCVCSGELQNGWTYFDGTFAVGIRGNLGYYYFDPVE